MRKVITNIAAVDERRIVSHYQWLCGALVLVTFLGALLIGAFESPAWRIRKVVIYAPDREMAAELRAVEFDGPSSYVLCTGDRIAKRVCQTSPRVASVAWVRKAPADRSVHLLAVPRRPAAAIKLKPQATSYFLVDESGLVYAAVRRPPPCVPILVSFPADDIAVRKYLEPKPRRLLQAIVTGLKAKPAPVRKVDFANPAFLVAYLRDGTPVRLGYMANLARKFASIGYILEAARARGDQIAYIDLSVPTCPYYMPKRSLAASRQPSASGPGGSM